MADRNSIAQALIERQPLPPPGGLQGLFGNQAMPQRLSPDPEIDRLLRRVGPGVPEGLPSTVPGWNPDPETIEVGPPEGYESQRLRSFSPDGPGTNPWGMPRYMRT